MWVSKVKPDFRALPLLQTDLGQRATAKKTRCKKREGEGERKKKKHGEDWLCPRAHTRGSMAMPNRQACLVCKWELAWVADYIHGCRTWRNAAAFRHSIHCLAHGSVWPKGVALAIGSFSATASFLVSGAHNLRFCNFKDVIRTCSMIS